MMWWLTVLVAGWILNGILFAVFFIAELIDWKFWHRRQFWMSLMVPGAYVLLAAMFLWEKIEEWRW